LSSKIKRREFIAKGVKLSSAAMMANALIPKSAFSKNSNNRKASGKHRNILLIMSDDHGIDQLGCYGNAKVKTPNLDKMAAEGVRFTNAFASVASCSPSRGSLLTGLYSHQNGQFGLQHNWHRFRLLDWVETVPSLLKKKGYKTGLVGKLHVESKDNLEFDYRVSGKELMGNRDVKKMADKANEFFSEDQENPFFLLVGYSDPHRANKGASTMKNVENFSGFANDEKYVGVTPTKFNPEDVTVPGYLPDIKEVRTELADQYESIARMDTGIGWIIENLKKSGRYEDTLIIYLSDNGIPFPGAKTTIYDSGVKLPMIINSPEVIKPGNTNNTMISYVDLMPTILEWANVKPPKYKLPGKSFKSILNENDDPTRKEIYNSHTFHEITMFYPMRSIRTKKFRYILNLFNELEYPFATDLYVSKTWQAILDNKIEKMGERNTRDYLYRPKEELFDITKDPNESNNLAKDPKYASVLEDLRERLQMMRVETDDYWLINDNYTRNSETFK